MIHLPNMFTLDVQSIFAIFISVLTWISLSTLIYHQPNYHSDDCSSTILCSKTTIIVG